MQNNVPYLKPTVTLECGSLPSRLSWGFVTRSFPTRICWNEPNIPLRLFSNCHLRIMCGSKSNQSALCDSLGALTRQFLHGLSYSKIFLEIFRPLLRMIVSKTLFTVMVWVTNRSFVFSVSITWKIKQTLNKVNQRTSRNGVIQTKRIPWNSAECKYDIIPNHKNYNFLNCDWFKKLLFPTNSLVKLLSDSLLSDSLLSDSL